MSLPRNPDLPRGKKDGLALSEHEDFYRRLYPSMFKNDQSQTPAPTPPTTEATKRQAQIDAMFPSMKNSPSAQPPRPTETDSAQQKALYDFYPSMKPSKDYEAILREQLQARGLDMNPSAPPNSTAPKHEQMERLTSPSFPLPWLQQAPYFSTHLSPPG